MFDFWGQIASFDVVCGLASEWQEMEAPIFHELDVVASDHSKEKASVAWGYLVHGL